jgi:hypothetical protein
MYKTARSEPEIAEQAQFAVGTALAEATGAARVGTTAKEALTSI